MKNNLSLKNKLLLTFLFIGVIPSLFIGFSLYYKSDDRIKKLVYSNMYEKLNFISRDKTYVEELIDKDEKIIIEYKNENLKTDGEYSDYIKKIDNYNFVDVDKKIKVVEIDQMLCGAIYNEEEGYRIYYFRPINKIHPSIDEIGTMFIKISLIIITLSIGLSLGVSYNITQRISKLINYTKKIEKGDLNFQIEVEKYDEIGVLIKSFNKMTVRLNNLINKTYRLEIKEKEAQFKALQAQISPHFLYNALDTINWSLIENGDYKTSSILGALSEILRYSIDDFMENVKIKDEIQQVDNYLKIQKSRFEDRFDYVIHVDENIMCDSIPKLLLQPLVENAVVHGVENCKSGGFIEIKGYYKEEKIIIEVNDNGKGIELKTLEEINKSLVKGSVYTDDSFTNHIGLVNVNERIKLVYGDDYCLKIDSVYEEGTTVKVMIGKTNDLEESRDV